ncbi:MAG: hypothetical protein GC137_10325 [Alphaproteobacteria bacterium]|nr:hypothetical protein [Alphaproteobacteria bacterium]
MRTVKNFGSLGCKRNQRGDCDSELLITGIMAFQHFVNFLPALDQLAMGSVIHILSNTLIQIFFHQAIQTVRNQFLFFIQGFDRSQMIFLFVLMRLFQFIQNFG